MQQPTMFEIRCMFVFVRIDIHSFRSTRCKTMYSGVTGTFGPWHAHRLDSKKLYHHYIVLHCHCACPPAIYESPCMIVHSCKAGKK
jgi:hypothetical protein